MSQAGPSQKYGYVDIKQSSKVRPRKLKSWKNKWAVLTKLSNPMSEQYVAKLDLYDKEAKWRSCSSEKTTFVLENITSIQTVKSKTHPHAFEIVESQPLLVMSGATELESYSWILSLQQIFTPNQIEVRKDCYQVIISPNEHSKKWSLSGAYCLTVSPAGIGLSSADSTNVISWGLNTLIRFNVEHSQFAEQAPALVIECGPNATTGQSCFYFQSNEAQEILGAIRQAICLALAEKQNARSIQPSRTRSLSATVSEKNFQKLLDNHPLPSTLPRSKSHSGSSSSSIPGSPTSAGRPSNAPGSPTMTGYYRAEMGSLMENEEKAQTDDIITTGQEVHTNEPSALVQNKQSLHVRSLSYSSRLVKDSGGYSEVLDVDADNKPVSRRNTISCESPDIDFDRLRSVSAVVASLKTSNEERSMRSLSVQDDNENKSDLDSAISSMTLSTTNEEFLKKDPPHEHGPECAEGCYPCCLTRRRSSSTPDLQAFWKTHFTKNSFENVNVYEELDELRASVQRINKRHDCDIPPELPARTYSLNFAYSSDNDKSSIGRRSFFNWPGRSYSTDAKDEHFCTCACDSIHGNGHGASCRSKMLKMHDTSANGNGNPAKHPHSVIDDINAIILQVQHVKHRRSSDITPVASSLLLSTFMPDKDSTKAANNQSYIGDCTLKTSINANCTDLKEGTGKCEKKMPAMETVVKANVNSEEDCLIHFFLDNENDSKSVTKQESLTNSATSSPSHAQLLKNITSNSSPQISTPEFSTLSQESRTWTWHGQNTLQNIEQQNSSSSSFPNPFES